MSLVHNRGKNLKNANKGHFLTTVEFMKAIDYLLESNVISSDTQINLFNWGEPLLNPDIKRIIKVLNDRDLTYGLSTNGSVSLFFEEENILKNLKILIFSMPGFSQKSYDKIHGFQFEKVKNNIQCMLSNFRKHGFNGVATISYHIYQFNFGELSYAERFAFENQISINPSFAYLNGISML